MKLLPPVTGDEKIRTLESQLRDLQKKYQQLVHLKDPYSLSPRRQEIVATIKEHHMVSFDFLTRCFRLVPPGTLHYDIAQLVRCGYIHKLGSTRGVVYTPVKEGIG